MALNFGKLDFDVSLNLTAAFPLDARSYFESLSAAELAAASAEEVGSTNTVYYYGQTIAVVENNIATLYIIQPNKTLTPLGGDIGSSQISVDSKQFEFDENGLLSLKNFKNAETGQILTIGSDGNFTWSTPIDTYTKTQIDEKLAAAGHLNRIIIESLDDINEYLDKDDYDKYIFMVPTGLEIDSDKYDEYIILEIDGQKFIEQVGSWEVNLEDYAKKTDLESYVLKDKDSRLITSAEAIKLGNLPSDAEKNIINSVSTDFTVDENRQLNLNNLSQSKIIGLEEILNKKVNAQEGYTLLSAADKKKLDALQLNGDDLQISGSVNTSQIADLEEWLNTNAGKVKGLSENNLTNDLYDQLTKSILITSVSDQLKVDSGLLSVVGIEAKQVKGLEDLLAEKASSESVLILESNITSIATALNSLKNTVTQNKADIATLQQQLTWQDVTD